MYICTYVYIFHSAFPSCNAIALARYFFTLKHRFSFCFNLLVLFVTMHDLIAPLSIYSLLWVFAVCPQTVYDFGVPSSGLLRWEVWQVRCTSDCQQTKRNCIHFSLSLSLTIYVYIYIQMLVVIKHIHVCMHISRSLSLYIYMHMSRFVVQRLEETKTFQNIIKWIWYW